MKPINKTLRTTSQILTLFIVVFCISSTTPIAEAQIPVTDVVNLGQNIINTVSTVLDSLSTAETTLKDLGLDTIAFQTANALISKTNNSVISWANTGFAGNPFAIQDYRALFADTAENETKNIIQQVRGSASSYSKDAISSIVKNFNITLDDKLKPTITDVCGDKCSDYLNGTTGSFTWANFASNIQPQNNPLGVLTIVSDELEKQKQAAKEAKIAEQTGTGFEPDADCATYSAAPIPQIDNPDYDPSDPNSEAQIDDPDYQPECLQKATKTSPQTIKDQISKALTEPLDRLNQVDEFKEVVGTAITSIINGLQQSGVNKIKTAISSGISDGLSAGTKFISPEKSASTNSQNAVSGQFTLQGNIEVIDFAKILYGTPERTDPATGQVTQEEDIGALAQLKSEIDFLGKSQRILQQIPTAVYSLDMCLPGPATDIWSKKFDNQLSKNIRSVTNGIDEQTDTDSYWLQAYTILHDTILDGVGTFKTQVSLYNLEPGIPTYSIKDFDDVSKASGQAKKDHFYSDKAKHLLGHNPTNDFSIDPDDASCTDLPPYDPVTNPAPKPRPPAKDEPGYDPNVKGCHQIPNAQKFASLVQQSRQFSARTQETLNNSTLKTSTLADLRDIEKKFCKWQKETSYKIPSYKDLSFNVNELSKLLSDPTKLNKDGKVDSNQDGIDDETQLEDYYTMKTRLREYNGCKTALNGVEPFTQASSADQVQEQQKAYAKYKIISEYISAPSEKRDAESKYTSYVNLQKDLQDSILECNKEKFYLYGGKTIADQVVANPSSVLNSILGINSSTSGTGGTKTTTTYSINTTQQGTSQAQKPIVQTLGVQVVQKQTSASAFTIKMNGLMVKLNAPGGGSTSMMFSNNKSDILVDNPDSLNYSPGDYNHTIHSVGNSATENTTFYYEYLAETINQLNKAIPADTYYYKMCATNSAGLSGCGGIAQFTITYSTNSKNLTTPILSNIVAATQPINNSPIVNTLDPQKNGASSVDLKGNLVSLVFQPGATNSFIVYSSTKSDILNGSGVGTIIGKSPITSSTNVNFGTTLDLTTLTPDTYYFKACVTFEQQPALIGCGDIKQFSFTTSVNAVTGGPTTLGGNNGPTTTTTTPTSNSGLSGIDSVNFVEVAKIENSDPEVHDFCVQHFYANDYTSYLYTRSLATKIVPKTETNGFLNDQSIVGRLLIPNQFTFDTDKVKGNGPNQDSTGDTHPNDPDDGINAGIWHGFSSCTQFYLGNLFDYYPQSQGVTE